MGYTDRQAALRAEALRTIPGVMAAKERDDVVGAAVLIDGYFQVATNLGITVGIAWSILWSATLHWTMELAALVASSHEVPMAEALQALGESALAWMVEERGVGGY